MRVLLLMLLGAGVASAQEFDAASVKVSSDKSVRMSSGGPGSQDPGTYTYNLAALRDLVFEAYGLTCYREQVDGPGWIDTPGYDVTVKVPPGATKEQFRKMLQNLLAERFKLTVHHQSVVLPVYELVLAKSGPKFKQSAPAPADPEPAPLMTAAAAGFPEMPPGRPGLAANYSMGPDGQQQSWWRAQQQSMDALAKMLSLPSNARRIVLDKTGLAAKYDFTLHYDLSQPGAQSSLEPTLTLFDALESQLGLKLVDSKQAFDKIVIDHAERVPAAN